MQRWWGNNYSMQPSGALTFSVTLIPSHRHFRFVHVSSADIESTATSIKENICWEFFENSHKLLYEFQSSLNIYAWWMSQYYDTPFWNLLCRHSSHTLPWIFITSDITPFNGWKVYLYEAANASMCLTECTKISHQFLAWLWTFSDREFFWYAILASTVLISYVFKGTDKSTCRRSNGFKLRITALRTSYDIMLSGISPARSVAAFSTRIIPVARNPSADSSKRGHAFTTGKSFFDARCESRSSMCCHVLLY